jgi:hypothetical protein
MPTLISRRAGAGPARRRARKQMLVIMDAKLITGLKVAMADDGTVAFHIVEERQGLVGK